MNGSKTNAIRVDLRQHLEFLVDVVDDGDQQRSALVLVAATSHRHAGRLAALAVGRRPRRERRHQHRLIVRRRRRLRLLSSSAGRYCSHTRQPVATVAAIRAIMSSVALTASRMDWSEEDTVKTTMNGISNITFIKRRHACRTEVLKNGDGRTDGRVFSLPRPRSDRPDETAPLALHYGD